ncbi:MAG: DUF2089 domain-containing protein [Acidobacteria bacterium]|nr:DUF2089 domain-containing protein [Acidobacteriota bacterium]
MDIGNATCANCGRPMQISRMDCRRCSVALEAAFDVPALARLPVKDQLFVVAFVRHHGSIKKMEGLLGVSYPTVKNRLRAIGAALDRSFDAPTPNAAVLEQLAAGEITVDQAIERIEG